MAGRMGMRTVIHNDSVKVGQEAIVALRIMCRGSVISGGRNPTRAFETERGGDVCVTGHHDAVRERLVKVVSYRV